MEKESEFLVRLKSTLAQQPYFLPYRDDIVSAISLGRPFSELDAHLRDVASGFLGMAVYQELCGENLVDDPKKVVDVIEKFESKHLLITKYSTIEEKVLNFSHVYFIVDITLFKLLRASEKWEKILAFSREQRNHFLIFGTLINGSYVHHDDVEPIDIVTLVPQFLDVTNTSQEIEIGVQLLGKKKRESKK